MYIIEDMKILSDELQTIANSLNLLYVRALNTADLNQTLQNIKVEKPILVYANLNPVEFPETGSNFEYYEIEAQLFILDRSPNPDPTAAQIDEQLSVLFDILNKIYDALTRWAEVYPSADIERGTANPSESIAITDEVLNGWEFELTVPISRKTYYCGV